MDDATKAKLDTLLCWKLDRFGRSLLDCLGNLQLLSDGYDGWIQR
jgi:DNA invertase Pin-like site-specific DNA recombinase